MKTLEELEAGDYVITCFRSVCDPSRWRVADTIVRKLNNGRLYLHTHNTWKPFNERDVAEKYFDQYVKMKNPHAALRRYPSANACWHTFESRLLALQEDLSCTP